MSLIVIFRYVLALVNTISLIKFIEFFEEPGSFQLRRVEEIGNPAWCRFYYHTRNTLLFKEFSEIYANLKRRTPNHKLQFAVSGKEFGATGLHYMSLVTFLFLIIGSFLLTAVTNNHVASTEPR